jgi:hypothetical protein
MGIQGCAESQNNWTVGFSQLASSRVPPMMRVMPGKPSASIVSIEPHRGQKRRVSFLPLSPALVKLLVVPCKENASFGTATTSTKADPLCF